MAFDISEVPEHITGVYRLILQRLWGREWVSSKEILEITGQAEFARRIRELRREFGFPIEQKAVRGDYLYKLTDCTPRYPTRRRPYFTDAQKQKIIEIIGRRCNICGKSSDRGNLEGRLMWDHRKPFDKGGETTSENGQLLCVECNNLKRQACGHCKKEDCGNCLFFRPEKSASILLIELDSHLLERLDAEARKGSLSIPETVISILRGSLDQ